MGHSLRLYHYWRSSSSWRVRWAFALKNIECEFVAVNLLTDESSSDVHKSRNPMGFVPVVEFLDKDPKQKIKFLAESTAIIEWADENYPTHPLFPKDSLLKARARQLAEIINAGTQPIQNLSVSVFHSSDPDEQKRWNQHWIKEGLGAYEKLVQETAGQYSIGDTITYPDLFLIPQCYNAVRNEVNLDLFPTLHRIYKLAGSTSSCQAAAPDRFKQDQALLDPKKS
jgi:maleylacetoacetate isomerase